MRNSWIIQAWFMRTSSKRWEPSKVLSDRKKSWKTLKLKFTASQMFRHLCGAFTNRSASRASYKFGSRSKFSGWNSASTTRSFLGGWGGVGGISPHLDCQDSDGHASSEDDDDNDDNDMLMQGHAGFRTAAITTACKVTIHSANQLYHSQR